MPHDSFRDRERAEEAVYFSQQDVKLIEKLRARAKLSEVAAALADKLKVDNSSLLARIMGLGVTLETGAAFILAPLVEIAWADGHVSPTERDIVIRLASERGVAPDSPDMNQLRQWLTDRPPHALFEAALEAIRAGISVLPRDEAEQRITAMIKACDEVAHAAGGIQKLLGLRGRVTSQERSVLDEINARLTG